MPKAQKQEVTRQPRTNSLKGLFDQNSASLETFVRIESHNNVVEKPLHKLHTSKKSKESEGAETTSIITTKSNKTTNKH